MAIVTAGTRHPVKRHIIVLSAGVALALAAAGAGAWQTVGRGSSPEMAAIAPAAMPAGATARPVAARLGDQRATIYLVGSPEQAVGVRAALNHGEETLSQDGRSRPANEIVVLGSAEDETRVLQGIDESEAIRAQTDLLPAQVVDLRAPAASVLPLDPAVLSDPEM